MAVTKRKMPRTTRRAPTPGKKKSTARATQPKKAVTRTTKIPAVRAARTANSSANATGALATAIKKMGTVTAKAMDAGKPSALNLLPPHDNTQVTLPGFDPLALARPWMRFCVQMAVANFAIQARMARTAMYLPQASASLR